MDNSGAAQADSRIAEPLSSAVLLAVGLGVIVAGIGAAAPWWAGWALSLPWVPFGGPLRLIQEVGQVVGWRVCALLGLAVGATAGLVLHAGEPVITVSDREIVIVKGRRRSRVARSQVDVAAVQGKHLVLRDREDVELVHERLSAEVARDVSVALHRHGWTT